MLETQLRVPPRTLSPPACSLSAGPNSQWLSTRVNHDSLATPPAASGSDKWVLKFIRTFLRRGLIKDGTQPHVGNV